MGLHDGELRLSTGTLPGSPSVRTHGAIHRAESSNDSCNGRSVIGGCRQVRRCYAYLKNQRTSDRYLGTCWHWLKQPFRSRGTEGRRCKSSQPRQNAEIKLPREGWQVGSDPSLWESSKAIFRYSNLAAIMESKGKRV